MVNLVRFLVYAHGNIISGTNGPQYDRPPVRKVRMPTNGSYRQFVSTICTSVGLDDKIEVIEIFHRHCIGLPSGPIYNLIAIVDDESVQDLFADAEELGAQWCQELFVNISGQSSGIQDDHSTLANPSAHPHVGDVSTQVCDVPHTHASTATHASPYQPTSVSHSPMRCEEYGPQPIHKALVDIEIKAEQEVALVLNPRMADENFDGVYYVDEDENPILDEQSGSEDEDNASDEVEGNVPPVLPSQQTSISERVSMEDGNSQVQGHVPVRNAIPFFNTGRDDGFVTFEQNINNMCNRTNNSEDLVKGMMFKTKTDLINYVKNWHVKHHCKFQVSMTGKNVWAVHCGVREEKKCKWRLRACMKKVVCLFMITRLEGPHTCLNTMVNQDHPHIDSNILAREFLTFVTKKPEEKTHVLEAHAKTVFGYKISRKQVWEGKRKAIAMVYGDWKKSYNNLPKLFTAMKVTNPGTQVEWGWTRSPNADESYFKWVFWTFAPSIEAFKHCRPLICIDGTFLYGKYTGVLLIACGVDGNNHVVPLCFCLAPSKTRESWSWFLRKIKHHVVGHRNETICLISNREASIIQAVNDPVNGWQLPFATHRFCIRHVASNFNKVYRNHRMKNLVTYAAMQTKPRKFEHIMKLIKEINKDALEWFNGTEPNGSFSLEKDQWTLAYDGFHRFGYMTSSLAEAYNSILVGARGLPVCALVRKIFYNCVINWEKRHSEATTSIQAGQTFTKYAQQLLERWGCRASSHTVMRFHRSTGLFDVMTGPQHTSHGLRRGGNHETVKLHEHTCECNKWQIYKIPCSHALAAATSIGMDSNALVGHWYKWTNQLRVYDAHFYPLGDELNWCAPNNFPILVPDTSNAHSKDKPKTKRYKIEMYLKGHPNQHICGICKQQAHNRRGCPDRNRQGTGE